MPNPLRSNVQQLAITNGETKVVHVTDGGQLVCWLPFFLEGLDYLRERTNWNVGQGDFLKELFYAFNHTPQEGIVIVHVSTSGPLGFLVASNATRPGQPRVAQISAVYTNRTCPSSFLELVTAAFQWGKSFGYGQMFAQSHKVRRSSVERFRKLFDGDPIITFTKTL
jgi:hypothetical protein